MCDPAALRAAIHARLCRRLFAPRLLGCAYRLVRLDTAPGIDTRDWIPADLIAML